MTLADRVAAFKAVFSKWAASWPWLVREQGRDVLYAVWVLGNDYRTRSTFYGAYPHGYLPRVMALFPDVPPLDDRAGRLTTLHVFSGSLPAGPYVRCDSHQPAECSCSVYDLTPDRDGTYDLVLADPPYSSADAEKYGTPMVARRRALAALARVTRVGGHLVWLDTAWPMHRKTEWVTVGRILIQRSTNHRVRLCSIFERVDATAPGRRRAEASA